MIAKSKMEIIAAIDTYMQKFQYRNSDWYVGITSDPQQRLFDGHKVNVDNGFWIYDKATSDSVAREVEHAYLESGHDGGEGGGDQNSVYVYAFVKLQGTVR